jgi:hypothetical protein
MHRVIWSLILFGATFVFTPFAALAVPITVPIDYYNTPGDQYRLAFVTSTTTLATSSDINYYNNFVDHRGKLSASTGSVGDDLDSPRKHRYRRSPG